MKRIKIIFLSLIILFMVAITKVEASSTGISASSTNVTQGSSVTVTGSVTSGAWNLTLSGAGQSKGLVGQTGSTDNASASTSITFTASSVGSYTFTLSGDVTDYYTDENSSVNKSITITVTEPPVKQPEPEKKDSEVVAPKPVEQKETTKKPETKKTTSETTKVEEKKLSSDTLLSSIKVEEGDILPEFNPEIKEYTLMVANEITQVNVSAITNNEKASYSVEGNKELQIGENIVKIIVIAEDGTAGEYIIKVNRGREALLMQALAIKYFDQEGKVIEVKLNPNFSPEIFEYTINNLEYWVEKLEIEAVANLEGAIIDVVGAEELKEGENIIVITIKIPREIQVSEEPSEIQYEIIEYKIKVNKNIKPTLLDNVKNWFKGIFGGITKWYNNNTEKVVLVSLSVCVIALAGLSIYIVVDNQKYKTLIEKVKKVGDLNKLQAIEEMPSEKILKDINAEEKIEEAFKESFEEETFEEEIKTKNGKHF